MPQLTLNHNLPKDKDAQLAAELSNMLAEATGKKVGGVSICVNGGLAMTFGGTQEPCAHVRALVGGMAGANVAESNDTLAKAICTLLTEKLDISPKRVFIELCDLKMTQFAWNGMTLTSLQKMIKKSYTLPSLASKAKL